MAFVLINPADGNDGGLNETQAWAQAELTAHGIEPKDPRVILEGPHVELPPGSLQTLALGVHELTTNALKHGAFAAPDRAAACRRGRDLIYCPERLLLYRSRGQQ